MVYPDEEQTDLPWEKGSVWSEQTPLGETCIVTIAPRGARLRAQRSEPDLAEALVLSLIEGVVFRIRGDGTWKVGVFRVRRHLWRCAFRRHGLTEEEAEREAERLRSCIVRGDFAWSGS